MDWLKQWAKERSFGTYGTTQDCRLVLCLETHTMFNGPQEELIQRLRPATMLHELLGVTYYNPSTHMHEIEPRRVVCMNDIEVHNRTRLEPTLKRWADEYSMMSYGIDASQQEIDVWARKRGIEEWSPQDDAVQPIRDRRIGELIREYYCRRGAQTALAIAGADHLRPRAAAHRILKEAQIPYFCIDMTGRYWLTAQHGRTRPRSR